MSPWAWPAVVFAGILVWPALRRRKLGLAVSFVAYAGGAVLLSSAAGPVLRFVAPLIVLLVGYRLTAPFYTTPSRRLEAWLMRSDDRLDVDRFVSAAPRSLMLIVEIAYIACYPFVIVAAIPAFRASGAAFDWHWTMVLSAELACYVTLPWVQARTPREIGNHARLIFQGVPEMKNKPGKISAVYRLNELIRTRLSVQSATIPSGHVAGPVAASLSAWMIAPEYGPWLMAGAIVIAFASVLGRYHYAIDAVLGALVGLAAAAVRAFVS